MKTALAELLLFAGAIALLGGVALACAIGATIVRSMS